VEIEVKDISKKYGNLQVLRNFNIKLEEKRISAILGPSGCGKTTLLNIISGLEKYDSGSIIGIENKKFSYIFQEDRLLPWSSVEENIHFVLKKDYKDQEIINITDKYLKIVGLEEYRHYYPNQLSGGMKQRVAIARAFAYPSDILLMDEPFKGLDMELKKNLIEAFISLWKKDKRTVIFVTHDMDEAMRLADYIFILGGKPLAIKEKVVTNAKK
jgi:NitT/TauT family transport system ATP-binding protein